LFPSRRVFLKSLSRSALVLSLESVLSLVRPLRSHAKSSVQQSPAKADETPSADLGISFLNVARESGLNAKTIYGA
jgi:hypothetical protein